MEYKKPSLFFYKLTQTLSWVTAKICFKNKVIRNEIKGKKGPFVVIANHQAALDFVNLIGATKERMHFVISNAFYNSFTGIRGAMDKIGVIPKQQFQTSLKDLTRMKQVLEHGSPLVIYPAGLMTEDGLSTPIPAGTYKFLKWLGVDVYAARISGTYFCTPKWSKKRRSGRTFLDIFKLFDKDELHDMDEETIREKTEEAILFDAYRENEKLKIKYSGGNNIEGLENVLYKCPYCNSEFTVKTKKSVIYCDKCGFAHESDKYGFLHNMHEIGNEIRYVSDWSRAIYSDLRDQIAKDKAISLSSNVSFSIVDKDHSKFTYAGEGRLTLSASGFNIVGNIQGEEKEMNIPISNFPSLPFTPGKCFDIQYGNTILRATPENGATVMKFINMVKIFYEFSSVLPTCCT